MGLLVRKSTLHRMRRCQVYRVRAVRTFMSSRLFVETATSSFYSSPSSSRHATHNNHSSSGQDEEKDGCCVEHDAVCEQERGSYDAARHSLSAARARAAAVHARMRRSRASARQEPVQAKEQTEPHACVAQESTTAQAVLPAMRRQRSTAVIPSGSNSSALTEALTMATSLGKTACLMQCARHNSSNNNSSSTSDGEIVTRSMSVRELPSSAWQSCVHHGADSATSASALLEHVHRVWSRSSAQDKLNWVTASAQGRQAVRTLRSRLASENVRMNADDGRGEVAYDMPSEEESRQAIRMSKCDDVHARDGARRHDGVCRAGIQARCTEDKSAATVSDDGVNGVSETLYVPCAALPRMHAYTRNCDTGKHGPRRHVRRRCATNGPTCVSATRTEGLHERHDSMWFVQRQVAVARAREQSITWQQRARDMFSGEGAVVYTSDLKQMQGGTEADEAEAAVRYDYGAANDAAETKSDDERSRVDAGNRTAVSQHIRHNQQQLRTGINTDCDAANGYRFGDGAVRAAQSAEGHADHLNAASSSSMWHTHAAPRARSFCDFCRGTLKLGSPRRAYVMQRLLPELHDEEACDNGKPLQLDKVRARAVELCAEYDAQRRMLRREADTRKVTKKGAATNDKCDGININDEDDDNDVYGARVREEGKDADVAFQHALLEYELSDVRGKLDTFQSELPILKRMLNMVHK